ncbi:hypothetical protein M5K25_000763 [Dendrobium thyrsiflorum]|uniref:Uncharacterized protein n=1 Tax=Dendrobium thyrsiflorum TaxID=117978 RepID=A0ABD0VUE1_DENTH
MTNHPFKCLDQGFLDSKNSSNLASGSSSHAFPDLVNSTHQCLPFLWISEEVILALAAPFEFAMVGKFPVRRPNLDIIRKFFFALKLTGEFPITLLDLRHVLIKLSNDLDYSRIFARRVYYWYRLFDISVESLIILYGYLSQICAHIYLLIVALYKSIMPLLPGPDTLPPQNTDAGVSLSVPPTIPRDSLPDITEVLTPAVILVENNEGQLISPNNNLQQPSSPQVEVSTSDVRRIHWRTWNSCTGPIERGGAWLQIHH